MTRRALVIGGLLLAGCAPSAFVRTEIDRAEGGLAPAIARLEAALADHRARVDGLARERAASGATTAAAVRAVAEAARAAERAGARSAEADALAAEVPGRAAAATAAARAARATAAGTERRLAALGAADGARTPVETRVVRFGFDRWTLDDRAATSLLDLLARLRAEPRLVVELEGYTDAIGAPAYNRELGRRRAESVRRFLVARGIELPRIRAIGLGDVRPVADNKTKAGRDQNRRVAIRVYALADEL
jgi:OOP family OmpA-OmpF porin